MNKFIKEKFYWSLIRKYIILFEHRKVARYCHKLIDEFDKKGISYNLRPKKSIGDKRVIWQYWGQGFDEQNLPPLVKLCFQSVDKYYGNDVNYEIIRLSDNDISQYLDLPEAIIKKFRDSYKVFFSDLVRCCLLSVYGGCWLDATIFLTGRMKELYWEKDFFVYQRDDTEKNKKYWENAFAYYYGWYPGFKVRMLNSIIFSRRNNMIITKMRNLLLFFWTTHDRIPNYFFFQILYNELINNNSHYYVVPVESDCLPHYLQQLINDPYFEIASFDEIVKLTTVHKLTNKAAGAYEKLVTLINGYYNK